MDSSNNRNIKRKKIRIAERKTRNSILALELECEKRCGQGDNPSSPCSKCEINRKFKEIVGLGIDELDLPLKLGRMGTAE